MQQIDFSTIIKTDGIEDELHVIYGVKKNEAGDYVNVVKDVIPLTLGVACREALSTSFKEEKKSSEEHFKHGKLSHRLGRAKNIASITPEERDLLKDRISKHYLDSFTVFQCHNLLEEKPQFGELPEETES